MKGYNQSDEVIFFGIRLRMTHSLGMLKLFPFYIYKVSGNSMLSAFYPDQKIIGLHWYINLKINDVVIAKIEKREVIKRITKIENQKVWLEGDNKKESTDSRTFGWIPKENIIAKVIMKLGL
jgi:SOS-response transcriptional repressor LexA